MLNWMYRILNNRNYLFTKNTSGAGTTYPSEHLSSLPGFSEVRDTRSLVLCVCFVNRLLSFFWPLCCMFFLDLWVLIIPLVSSNSSC
jgi:hypothetical protein